MFFSRRRRQELLAEREAAGESFWTNSFSEEVRNGVLFAALDSSAQAWPLAAKVAHGLLVRAYGKTSLSGGGDPGTDLTRWVTSCSDEVFPDAVEAFDDALGRPYQDDFGLRVVRPDRGHFRSRVAETFREHRVAFDFIDGQMHSFRSRELFSDVVRPTLTLLAGVPTFAAAEEAGPCLCRSRPT